MPSLIDIVIRGRDLSGPAFQSAGTNLARLTQGGTTAATGLARVETQVTETGSAILTLGIAGSTTATRMRSLTVSILNQEDALQLAERRLHEVRAAHDADSLAVGRAQLAYDRLNRSLVNNRARMQDLRQSGDVSGISVVGLGGGMGGMAGGVAGGMAGLRGAAGMLGLALGATEVAQFGARAIGAANTLEKTEATVRALAQTTERYTEVVSLARHNQALYGGTSQETLQALGALLPMTSQLTISLEDLDKTTRLLAASNLDQGIEGAAFAMREFLTATGAEGAQSIADRFNLIKSNITAIIATTPDATERTRLLNDELGRMGITEQLITAQVATRAATYDRLGAAASNAREAVGGLLGNLLLPSARAATGLLTVVSGIATGDLSAVRRGAGQYLQLDQFGGGSPSVVNNITVHGSLVTEREIASTTRRINSQTAARNGGSVRR